eukprot:350318-Chlamydomonas_euryale.AAC.12
MPHGPRIQRAYERTRSRCSTCCAGGDGSDSELEGRQQFCGSGSLHRYGLYRRLRCGLPIRGAGFSAMMWRAATLLRHNAPAAGMPRHDSGVSSSSIGLQYSNHKTDMYLHETNVKVGRSSCPSLCPDTLAVYDNPRLHMRVARDVVESWIQSNMAELIWVNVCAKHGKQWEVQQHILRRDASMQQRANLRTGM